MAEAAARKAMFTDEYMAWRDTPDRYSQPKPRQWFLNPVADKYDDLYTAVGEAVDAVERGDATPDQRELATAWDHASRFAGAHDRSLGIGQGQRFLEKWGWTRY